MVIGTGLMAQSFCEYKNSQEVLIFASGVSNSIETNCKAFDREFKLLQKTILNYPNHKFIYFSTCSIDDLSVNERPYIAHKLQIEDHIKANVKSYLICRVSNVIGSLRNKHTIINYLVNAVENNVRIDVWSEAERNIIDIDDVRLIVDTLLKEEVGNCTVSIATNESILVTSILKQIELYLQKKATINLITKGNTLDFDVSSITHILKDIEVEKGKGVTYISNLLKKYY